MTVTALALLVALALVALLAVVVRQGARERAALTAELRHAHNLLAANSNVAGAAALEVAQARSARAVASRPRERRAKPHPDEPQVRPAALDWGLS